MVIVWRGLGFLYLIVSVPSFFYVYEAVGMIEAIGTTVFIASAAIYCLLKRNKPQTSPGSNGDGETFVPDEAPPEDPLDGDYGDFEPMPVVEKPPTSPRMGLIRL